MRYLIAFLLGVAVVSATIQPSRSADAGSLLAMHGQYVGWQFGSFATMRVQGNATDSAGNAQGSWQTLEIGAAYRTVTQGNVPGMTGDSGFTGRVFWNSDENGFTRPNYSAYQNYAISVYALFNEGTSQLSGTLETPVTIGSTSYPVVRVTPPNGDAIDLAIDPSTGAYVRATVDPGGPYETTFNILGYTGFGSGKRYIGSYRIEGSDGTATVTSVQANVPVSTSDLHPPSPTATWNFTNAQPIPITVTTDAAIVDATINGVPGRFVIDSGASGLVVSGDFASRAHLATTGGGDIQGLVGPHSASYARVTLGVGGNTLQNVSAVVAGRDYTVNVQAYHEEEGTVTINGYLGFPLFGAAIVTLSMSNKTLTIQDPSQTVVDHTSGWPAQVDLSDNIPMIPVLVDGRATLQAALDSGNGSFVSLSQDAVTRYHIPILASAGTMSTVGQMYQGVNSNFDPEAGTELQGYVSSHVVVRDITGQEEIEPCSTVSSIALGPITYQNTTACVSQHMTGDWIIMGFAFMENFDLVFDYPEGIILFRPHHQ